MTVSSAGLYRMDVLELVVVLMVIIHRVEGREGDRFRVGQGRGFLRVGYGGGATRPAHEAPEARDGAVALDHVRQLVLRFLV